MRISDWSSDVCSSDLSLTSGAADDCGWSPLQWNRPIPATELREATQAIGGLGNELITGAAFTDEAVMARGDLDRFRILHFATHGLVTPPHPGCPARPALQIGRAHV